MYILSEVLAESMLAMDPTHINSIAKMSVFCVSSPSILMLKSVLKSKVKAEVLAKRTRLP